MNYFRLIYRIFLAVNEQGRRLTFEEFLAHEERKIEQAETAMLRRAIGNLAVAWATVEILLDYANYFLIN
ncbi:MAG: hypothetical protein QOF07_161 [Bradyrhizobium sp.]|jgi:hypothetical protein|nr:hypothetical protein [Bradyrhizobium sp.]